VTPRTLFPLAHRRQSVEEDRERQGEKNNIVEHILKFYKRSERKVHAKKKSIIVIFSLGSHLGPLCSGHKGLAQRPLVECGWRLDIIPIFFGKWVDTAQKHTQCSLKFLPPNLSTTSLTTPNFKP
jgi:hypothetical protein